MGQRTTIEDTHDNQYTPTRSHNIQAKIRQDKPPDIDIRDTPGSTLSVGRELEEEGYPVVDYESDRQTAMSTTVR
uniref:Ulp1 protease-like n=2 Tax=Oryza sativa subsp. japonica TaxID=39947 RepID=A0A5S6RCK8_ORYSJ|nr:Unknown protein [Oryza sativa]AAM08422.1 Unknown protein [Oryza sativa]AAP52070.1 hypothetical protein LOC_Os10g05110 [Oryza sativa Japonica Group]